MRKFGYQNLLNYIDYLIYLGLPSNIDSSYTFLLHLLQDLGLEISQNKLIAPSTAVVCLGILVDSVNQIIFQMLSYPKLLIYVCLDITRLFVPKINFSLC